MLQRTNSLCTHTHTDFVCSGFLRKASPLHKYLIQYLNSFYLFGIVTDVFYMYKVSCALHVRSDPASYRQGRKSNILKWSEKP